MRFKEKYRPVNIQVILILAVYIFVSLTNLYFVERQTRNFNNKYKHSFVAKRKIKNMFRTQKAASTTVSQSQSQSNQINQKAALFFIILLFASGASVIKTKPFLHSNQLTPDYQYAFLRYRSIQIWLIPFLFNYWLKQLIQQYIAGWNSTSIPLSVLLNHQGKKGINWNDVSTIL